MGSGLADGGSNIRWATGVVFIFAVGWVGPSIWGQIFCLGRVDRLWFVLAVLFSCFSRWRIRRWLGRTFEFILCCQERMHVCPHKTEEIKFKENTTMWGKQSRMKFSGRTAAAIVEFPDNRILLIKRATVPFKGYWALPGGKVDVGETVEETVVREVKEETGVEVEIVEKIGEYHENGVQDGVEYDFYPACFLVKLVGGKIERQEREIECIRLFNLKELPDVLAFKHANMIHDYILMRAQRNI